VTGQTLNWDPNGPSGTLAPGYSGGVSNGSYLQRYYGGTLAACRDSNYIGTALLESEYGELNLSPGMCGWTQGIAYYGDDQNTEFDALQVTLAQSYYKGLATTINYQWANAFDDQTGYWTWSHSIPHQRDSNVRAQQVTMYGSYDLPFGKGKQFAPGANHAEDLIIGGWQLSYVLNWAGGLPFGIGYSNFGGSGAAAENCNNSTGGTAAPCRPNANGHLKTSLTSASIGSGGTISRNFWTPNPQLFAWPGLDQIGNAGANTYRGPGFFNTDMAITKSFTIWEQVVAKFRMDAFNAFNHINAGNPGNTDVSSATNFAPITGGAPGYSPRQLEFSLHVQF
jgi:hypothetical protein